MEATALVTGNPNDMLGTKTPSMTSRCIMAERLSFSIEIALLRLPKSALRIEGEISIPLICNECGSEYACLLWSGGVFYPLLESLSVLRGLNAFQSMIPKHMTPMAKPKYVR